MDRTPTQVQRGRPALFRSIMSRDRPQHDVAGRSLPLPPLNSHTLPSLSLKLILFSRVPSVYFFFQAEDGIRDWSVTGVQTCALPISQQSSAAHRAQPGPCEFGAGGQRVRVFLRDRVKVIGPFVDLPLHALRRLPVSARLSVDRKSVV